MKILLHTEFAASRKEPLVEMFDRVRAAFATSGVEGMRVDFDLSDSPIPKGISSVDRVLKRYPDMKRFFEETAKMPMLPAARRLSSQQSPEAPADPEVLRAIAAGVPKSFPFHHVLFTFAAPSLGEGTYNMQVGEVSPGVILSDSWWVSGRTRSLAAFNFVEAERESRQLPGAPPKVAALFAAIGKARKTVQIPLPGENPAHPAAAGAGVLKAVGEVVADYQRRMPEILERIEFPHDLPPAQEARQTTPLGAATGPKKPVLLKAFAPMGYDCKGDSGTFTLRRRTPANLTCEIFLDVGSWSRSLTGFFKVHGLGFGTTMGLQVSRRAGKAQYPIGDRESWQMLVDNMAAVVRELERSFVPAVEAAAGPSPAWFNPED